METDTPGLDVLIWKHDTKAKMALLALEASRESADISRTCEHCTARGAENLLWT